MGKRARVRTGVIVHAFIHYIVTRYIDALTIKIKQRSDSRIVLTGILQWCTICSNGEKTTLCYIRRNDRASLLCDGPKTVQCCTQHLSVDDIDVYGTKACNSTSQCGNSGGCCNSRNILNVSAENVASLKETFTRTNCFNNVDHSQLPFNSGLVSVVVTFLCKGKYS